MTKLCSRKVIFACSVAVVITSTFILYKTISYGVKIDIGNSDSASSSRPLRYRRLKANRLNGLQHRFSMKSNLNSTKFHGGSDAGLSKECLLRNYGDLRGWPKASVIIAFCENELLVDVLHTVHSVVQRSPDELLQEVILVDDNTTKADFKELFENYCSAVFGDRVRIIRVNHSLGLIKARLLGARMARGDVIISMDAHMEVQETWLQALLYEIRLNYRTMATSLLDWMKPVGNGVWSYELGINCFMCIFTWDLGFGFGYPRPEVLKEWNENRTKSFPAPCSVGTIWAMNKDFFTEVGELDPGMERWGGENIDLPLRVWLFGGRVVQVPCSHAAHKERPHQRDYRYGWDRHINRNYKRAVEVWFDDYKKHVYRKKPELEKIDAGDLSERFAVKKRARHNFDWFLKNIYPELGIYDNSSFGYDWLRNLGMDKCLHNVGGEFVMWECLGKPSVEGVWWTTDGHMRSDLTYWHASGKTATNAKLGPEGATGYYQADWITRWVHWKGGPMMAYRKPEGVKENICLEAYISKDNKSLLRLNTCDPKNQRQRWEWKQYTSDYRHFMDKNHKSSFNSDYHKTLLDVMSSGKWS